MNHFEPLIGRATPWAFGFLLLACGGNETPATSAALTDAVAREYGRGARTTGNTSGNGNGGSSSQPVAPVDDDAEDEPPPDTSDADEADDEDEPAAPEPDPEPEPSQSFPDCDGFSILQTNCGQSSCHGEGSNLGTTFAASEAEARTYAGRSGTLSCASQGPLIDPDNPGESIIVHKMSDDPPCGTFVPPSGILLPDDDVECVTNWIANLE